MRYRFEDFELGSAPRELRRQGVLLPVQPKVLDLLVILARNRGGLVSESALAQELWPGVHVEATALRRLVKEARRAVGDDGEGQRVIRTERGRGYGFVVAPIPDRSDGAAFVGREKLLRDLESALDEARAGRGRLMLLEGAAGIGKTRTALEFCARARALGAETVFVACGVAEGAAAFAPWLEVTRELVAAQRLRREELPRALRDALADAPSAADELSPSAATSARLRLLEALDELLRDAARSAPLVVAFDDLHATDPDTLRSLVFLAPRLLRRRVTLLGGYRPEALLSDHAVALAEVVRSTHASVFGVASFEAAEIEALIEQATGERAWSELAQLLLRVTAGNPFWLQQILRDLTARRRLARETSESIEAEIPIFLRPVLRRRLAAVSARVDGWLRCAAAIGREFELPLLSSVTDCSVAELEAGLAEAQRTDLVQRQRSRSERWEFTHDLVREGLYDELREASADCARVHLRIVTALDARSERSAAELAHHAERALPLIATKRAIDLRIEAAHAASARGGFEDAARHLARALAQVQGDSPAAEGARCELMFSRAEALEAARGRDDARSSYRAAALSAERCGAAETFARAALGYAHRRTGLNAFEPETAQLLERARASLPAERGELAIRTKSRIGAELSLREPRDGGERIVEEAVREARALGDLETLGWVLDDYSYAFWSPRDTRAWTALCAEIEQIGERLGDPELRFRGARFRAMGTLDLADRAGFLDALRVCEQVDRDAPLPYTRALVPALRATLALLDGRLADARQSVDLAARFGSGATESGFEAAAGVLRVEIARASGEGAALAPALREIARRQPNVAGLGLYSALLSAELGDVDAGRAALDAFIRDALADLPRNRLYLPTLFGAAELCVATGAGELAAPLARTLRPFAAIGVTVGTTGPFLGAVAHHLGGLALLRGDRASALAHLEAGASFHERLGAPLWLAKSRALLERARAD